MVKLNMKAIEEEAARIRLEEEQRAVWDSFCENCREPLDKLEHWAHAIAAHEDDDDPRRTYYCAKCITIDAARKKLPGR